MCNATVFDGEGEDAHPALCDFDLSLDISADAATMSTSTYMRGTLLYMPPGAAEPPSPARDIFALGVTLLDALFFHGDASRLPTEPSTGLPGLHLDVAAAQAGLDHTQPLPSLVRRMIERDAAMRPSASDVREELAAIVASLDMRDCVVCGESVPMAEGLSCHTELAAAAAAAGAATVSHFVCGECMSGDVQHRQVIDVSQC